MSHYDTCTARQEKRKEKRDETSFVIERGPEVGNAEFVRIGG